jgi:hypothetical protein
MRILLSATFAAGLVAPAAHAFTAINGLTVNPVAGNGAFEVTSQGGDGPRQLWCAAAQYARQVQGTGNHDRIYILQGYGQSQTRPGYRAVAFTTRPTAELAAGPRLGDSGNYFVSMRRQGFSLTTGQAENFCGDALEDKSLWPF